MVSVTLLLLLFFCFFFFKGIFIDITKETSHITDLLTFFFSREFCTLFFFFITSGDGDLKFILLSPFTPCIYSTKY